jgi:hypothetical protein
MFLIANKYHLTHRTDCEQEAIAIFVREGVKLFRRNPDNTFTPILFKIAS